MSRAGPRGIGALAKRGLDLLGAGVGLAVVAIPMAAIAVAVRLTMGSPVLFRQRRAGWQGRPFALYKFRTMTDRRDAEGRLLPDADRLTGLGRFLRRRSLDELPELFNVLKGDMSLVGPRPLLPEYLELYTPEQARRHEVRPGITGWAQINGRNALSWAEKFRHDIWYVNHWSIWLDMKILLLTPWVVLAGRGVSQPGRATADHFKGEEGQDVDPVSDGTG